MRIKPETIITLKTLIDIIFHMDYEKPDSSGLEPFIDFKINNEAVKELLGKEYYRTFLENNGYDIKWTFWRDARPDDWGNSSYTDRYTIIAHFENDSEIEIDLDSFFNLMGSPI
jgi:hypothetical protein